MNRRRCFAARRRVAPFPPTTRDSPVCAVARASLAAALVAGASACTAADPPSPWVEIAEQAVEVVPSPAAPGSGEPFLAPDDAGVWMSWIEPAAAGHRVAAARYDGEWGPTRTVAEGDDFFVNWADFPSVQPLGERLVAHWLQRGGQGTYDYGVRAAWSDDGGATWSEPWTPHGDDTPTEHGFVSFFALDGAERAGGQADPSGLAWAVWLDGRAMVEEGGAMAIRARRLPWGGPEGGPAGPPAPQEPRAHAEVVLDARTCECCQTDAVVADGVPVVAYRDRGEGEVRNIHVTRRLNSGWTEGAPVHDDGWVIGGCPVNGPAMAAAGSHVAVAWFTAPAGEARVNVAFSADAAASFGPPVRLDAGQPLGRVDVVLLRDGSALVTWLERSDGASILSRRVSPDGATGPLLRLAASDEARASGFPRIARLGEDHLMLAWTAVEEAGRVRTAVFALDAWEGKASS